MSRAVSTAPFQALATALRRAGHEVPAQRLDDILTGTWTTSSELVHELGGTVMAIRRDCRPLDAEQRSLLRQCLREVRKAWPGFGWFSWLPW